MSAGALGALIGSFVVPGLGTMIGAFLGGILGSIFSESTENKLKRLQDKVQAETDKIISTLIEKINFVVEDNVKIAVDKLSQEQISSFSKLHCNLPQKPIVSDLLYGVIERIVSEDISTSQRSMLFAIMAPDIITRNKRINHEKIK